MSEFSSIDVKSKRGNETIFCDKLIDLYIFNDKVPSSPSENFSPQWTCDILLLTFDISRVNISTKTNWFRFDYTINTFPNIYIFSVSASSAID